MKLFYDVLFMMIFSFIIQYYVMSYIMVDKPNNITNSLGKFYISSMMSVLMGILEVTMNNFMMKKISWNYYTILFVLLFALLILYKKQIGINDTQYLNEMIEHHSMAILTSNEILGKTEDYKIKKLASDIKITQQDEIKIMKQLLRSKTQ